MQIYSTLPLSIKITSYLLARPGRYFGPSEYCFPSESAEIEFEVRTLTGHELTESDFSETAWTELYDEVLATYEAALEEAHREAAVDRQELTHQRDNPQ